MAVNYRHVSCADEEIDQVGAASDSNIVEAWQSSAGTDLLVIRSTGVKVQRLVTGATAITSAVLGAAMAGTGQAVTSTGCTDSRGLISLTQGNAPATGIAVTVTFGTPYAIAPGAVILGNASVTDTVGATASGFWVSSITTTTFVVNVSQALTSTIVYSFYYWVVG